MTTVKKYLGALRYMKRITAILFILFASMSLAEIPNWYKRDIVIHIEKADAVIVYRVKNVSLHSSDRMYYYYKINTETVQALKGSPPKGECYFVQTEGEWKHPSKVEEERIVILSTKYTGECGAIEPGYGAPATEEYITFFQSIIKTL